MTFLCIHGHMRADCTICIAIDEAMYDFNISDDEMEESFNDYLYDQYLDIDERLLRENEEEV